MVFDRSEKDLDRREPESVSAIEKRLAAAGAIAKHNKGEFIMSKLFKSIMIALLASVLFAGCEKPGTTLQKTPEPTASTAPLQTSEPSPQEQSAKASDQAITLPLLDALLADESFATAARTKAGLSDEQLQKLKDRAQNDVLKMNEDDSDSRSTREASIKAEKAVREILGEDKGKKFIAFVQQQLASENREIITAAPNEVPTDTRIVVNAPEYRMDVFQDGKLIKTYKVGIGYPEFPLPTGLRKATDIILNPAWPPPDEPWVKGKFKPFKKVEAGSKDNPLGIAKVPIGPPNLIHGGKADCP